MEELFLASPCLKLDSLPRSPHLSSRLQKLSAITFTITNQQDIDIDIETGIGISDIGTADEAAMATINLPDIILAQDLKYDKAFYTEAHTIALIDPDQAKPASINRSMSILQAIALLLTTSPGESVAVHTRLLPHRTIITYARNTISTASHDRHANRLMRYLAKAGRLDDGNGLRHQNIRYEIYAHLLSIIIRACHRKVLSRMRKLKDAIIDAIITASKQEGGPPLPKEDGEWRDVHYYTVFSVEKLDDIEFCEFSTTVRDKMGHSPDDPTWCIAAWLAAFAGRVLAFDVDKVPKPRSRNAEGGAVGANGGDDTQGDGYKCDRERVAAQQYFDELYDIISACVTVVKVRYAEVVVGDREIFRRMCKLAEYAMAMGKVLEAVAGRKTEYVLREVCSKNKIHGWFPKDAHCMLTYYCDSTGSRKCTADQLYEAFHHPNNFPSEHKPYGMFNQIPFTVHPELTLVCHLAAQNSRLPAGRANIKIGLTKRSCWLCEQWLTGLGELLTITVTNMGGFSGKKTTGWQLPVAVKGVCNMEEFIDMVNLKLFRKTTMKARTILGRVWGEAEKQKREQHQKAKASEKLKRKEPQKTMAHVFEDANATLAKWLEQAKK
ncbi:hypothetical protein Dda_7343 [Drechslerella dactyloides]|uniref:Uncharacterized protein n=1 Tax=Drechslerella dactyloides TaxID=74499 RepID=A0AAD6NI88_DREDA|nr:hypothetical protein Dda_7343 [Drechslerella dactyloides]